MGSVTGACSWCCGWISLDHSFWELGAFLPIYLTLEILAPRQCWSLHWRWIKGSLKTGGGVPEDLPGRFSLLGWVQLVMGSHAWGEIMFRAPNPYLLPARLQLH